ncbi:unnamed protein product, partial [Owenia fusiformis]
HSCVLDWTQLTMNSVVGFSLLFAGCLSLVESTPKIRQYLFGQDYEVCYNIEGEPETWYNIVSLKERGLEIAAKLVEANGMQRASSLVIKTPASTTTFFRPVDEKTVRWSTRGDVIDNDIKITPLNKKNRRLLLLIIDQLEMLVKMNGTTIDFRIIEMSQLTGTLTGIMGDIAAAIENISIIDRKIAQGSPRGRLLLTDGREVFTRRIRGTCRKIVDVGDVIDVSKNILAVPPL